MDTRPALIPKALVLGLTSAFMFALALACSQAGQNRSSSRATVRDSAGVEIRTFPAGGFTDTLSPVPLLTIGREGDPDYEFFDLRKVVSLGSGNVVVANGGTHELRFYDADGRYLRTVGRRGGGPAEFGFLSDLWVRPGDTLVVLDSSRRRIVFFDSAGTLVREVSYARDLTDQPPAAAGPCAFPGLMGLMEDGTRVTSGWGCMELQGSEGRRPMGLPVVLVRPEGKVELGSFTAGWIWERASATDLRSAYAPIPFLGSAGYAVGSDRIYLSEGIHFEIRVFDAHGALTGLLREDTVPPTVTEADRRAYDEEELSSPSGLPPHGPFPDRFGSYSGLQLSFEGDLWARHMPRPGDKDQRWLVFSQGGDEIRRVVVPEVRVTSVRAGRIYGYQTDTLGIQTVLVLEAGG